MIMASLQQLPLDNWAIRPCLGLLTQRDRDRDRDGVQRQSMWRHARPLNPAKSPEEKGSRSTERVLAPTSRSSGDDSHQWKWKAHRHLELRQCSPAAPDDDDTRASMPVQALALEILLTSPTSCCIWLLSLLLYADNKAAEQWTAILPCSTSSFPLSPPPASFKKPPLSLSLCLCPSLCPSVRPSFFLSFLVLLPPLLFPLLLLRLLLLPE